MQAEEAPAGELDEVVRCSCGASSAQQSAPDFLGLWLQCDRCKCWQHGSCVGHPDKAPKGEHVLQAACAERSWKSVSHGHVLMGL